ncbi:hypothetical protein D9M68_853700 [compost metagenome]
MQVVEGQIDALAVCPGVLQNLCGVVGPGATIAADYGWARRQHFHPFGNVSAQLKAEGGGGGAVERGGLSVHVAMVGGMRGVGSEEGVQ